VTSVLVAWLPSKDPRGIQFWVFHRAYRDTYMGTIEEWNRARPETPFAVTLLASSPLERRILSGFLAGTPVADFIALHNAIIPKVFLGPVDQIGLLDITDRLYAEGLYERINEPSFSIMTSRGRIFALPHDVHPVLLAYRADIVEAAGIDMSQIETWDDYFRVLRPLMVDNDGDGRPDRYLLSLSEDRVDILTMLILQNDGQLFDEQDRPLFANERNAETACAYHSLADGARPSDRQCAVDLCRTQTDARRTCCRSYRHRLHTGSVETRKPATRRKDEADATPRI